MGRKPTSLEGIRSLSQALARRDRDERQRLVALRREQGLKQADVAAFLGVTEKWVHNIEKYDADPSMSALRRYEVAVTHGRQYHDEQAELAGAHAHGKA